MNGYPSCCEGCDIASDFFSRSTIGSGWTQSAGTWSLASYWLTTESSNGLLVNATAHPDGLSAGKIKFSAAVETVGSAIRGILNYESSSNYLYAEWTVGATCTTLKFYKVATGSHSQLGTTRTLPLITPGTFHQFEMCYTPGTYPATDGEIFAVVTIDSDKIRFRETVTGVIDGDQVGLGTGTVN